MRTNKVYLCDLKEGDKFQIPSMILPLGYKRTFIFKKHIGVRTLLFKEVNGNGGIRLPYTALFKLKVGVVAV